MNNEKEIILKAQKGDSKAFEELVYLYDKQVLSIAASFRNIEDDAKDIYQEVFVRVYKGLKNFQFKSEFSTWLFRITKNVCITYYSRNKKNSSIDSLDRSIFENDDESVKVSDTIKTEDYADGYLLNEELSQNINDAIDTLPKQQKYAFVLKHFEGLKIKEIAAMMQCNEGTVKRYLFNASSKLRTELKEFSE